MKHPRPWAPLRGTRCTSGQGNRGHLSHAFILEPLRSWDSEPSLVRTTRPGMWPLPSWLLFCVLASLSVKKR